jgi:hypothetical protein
MSAFNTLLEKSRTRNFGGTNINNACEPYLTGYHFIKWFLPKTLQNYIGEYEIPTLNGQTDLSGSGDKTKILGDILSAACMSFTPPGQSIEFVQYDGSCGVQWNNPVKVHYGSNINIKYTEMSGLPIYKIHKCWFDMIRDAHQGMAKGYEPDVTHIRSNYAGKVLYWTTKPDGCTIEYYACYSGVMPEKDNGESFGSDIASIDKLEMDCSYKIDHIWTDRWVYEEILKWSVNAPYGGYGGTLWSRDGYQNNIRSIKSM